ncbi:Outer membrane receptor proteins, mostly Fe transport [Sinomicrobium oceani]|uniref:Outer membrane receptor proteins, mostly Fe transport n=1 Tax=Sinomicrobium oceani TaxID=1150368 RepID=A0A1K1QDW3_9FLAO|nr:outer membrane beta-barrel family protein [Sinomicrobium oceani]SFW57819.1 Outer membrane receptor proteins, mostly Fe transport [Sinomicrobium oceani]
MKPTLLLFFILPAFYIHAQTSVHGKLLDKDTELPVIYANVTVIASDSTMLGAVSDEEGRFSIARVLPGNYTLTVNFMGYREVQKPLRVDGKNSNVGTIYLEEQVENLEEVVVKSSRPAVQYKVDRQIINAEAFPAAHVAIDLMENVPSVSVDVEGNIKYRGDGTFRVFINGHPVANGVEKLRQIPSSQIERIEIITNPPAQYASEGTAGIIQVILKKNRMQGYAINANTYANSRGAVQGYFSIDKKSEKSGWYINTNGGHNVWSNFKLQQVQTVMEDGVPYQTRLNQRYSNGADRMYVEAGFNHDITDKDYIDMAVHINPFKMKNFRTIRGNVSAGPLTETGDLQAAEIYRLRSSGFEKFHYIGGTLNYEHYFKTDKSHKISAYADVSYYLSPYEEQQKDRKLYTDSVSAVGYEGFENKELVLDSKINYTLPLSEKSSLETGMEIEVHQIPLLGNENGTFDAGGNLVPYSGQRTAQTVDFRRNIYSGYATFKSGIGLLEYQLGLRVENTYTKTDYSYRTPEGEIFFVPGTDKFTQLFPTVHLLYNISEQTQLVGNYSRRIDRPGYWQLTPYRRYQSVTAYFEGNPDIRPSYINAYEVGFKQNWSNKNYLSIQLFHRAGTNVINDINTSDAGGLLLIKPHNVGTSKSTGIEIMGNYKPAEWWETNLSTSLFDYRLHIDFENEQQTRKQFNYEFKWNNTLSLPHGFILKYNMNYNSPVQEVQGTREGFLNSSASLQKAVADDRWTFTVGAYNLLGTAKYDYNTTGEGFSNNQTYNYDTFAFLKVAFKLDNQQ